MNERLRRLTNCSPHLETTEKAVWMTELNLFLMEAGYNNRFRNSMTRKIVSIYRYMMNKHIQGNNMYTMRDSNSKSSSSNWYKRLGANLAIQVPGTRDQVLATTIKNRLQEYTGDNILIVESQGKKLISTLAK